MANEELLEMLASEDTEHPAWDDPIICRVEVDLPAWLKQLTGDKQWEMLSESEDENCIIYMMRHKTQTNKQAEVTLYHTGYALVDVDGESIFKGTLTRDDSDFAQLSYFDAEGEEILLH